MSTSSSGFSTGSNTASIRSLLSGSESNSSQETQSNTSSESTSSLSENESLSSQGTGSATASMRLSSLGPYESPATINTRSEITSAAGSNIHPPTQRATIETSSRSNNASLPHELPDPEGSLDNDSAQSHNYNEFIFHGNHEDDSSESSDDDSNEDIDEDNVENGSESFNELNKFLENPKNNETVTASFVVSIAEMLLAILHFSIAYNLTCAGTTDLCKMVNHFLNTSVLPDTKYYIDKYFFPGGGIEYHAVCPTCQTYIGQFNRAQRQILCTVCNESVNLKNPGYHDYFVILNVKSKIKSLIEKSQGYYSSIVSNREQRNDFQDICDGNLYKQLVASLPLDERQSYVTATFNSDGSPVFKSSKFSIWPIQINLNEIPVNIRNKMPITYALWFGHDKPDMVSFLSPFVNSMNSLAEEGIACTINNQLKTIRLYASCCCVDSIARAPMQGLKQFNGHFGCNWCLHNGESVLHGKGRAIKYTLQDQVPQRRTELESIRHIEETSHGFKTASPLLNLKGFNIIDGFVPDAMHLLALGIARQFADLWFSTTGELYSISSEDQSRIDNLLQSFKVPNQLAKLSRWLKDRKYWTARDYDNWVLHYSIPVLSSIPHFRVYVEHWSLLVEAYHLLMKDCITVAELRTADNLLKRFVALTEEHYTKAAMTFNIHQLTHLAQSVADWGPLWAHSGYVFESGNGQLKRAVHAANGVINQVCRHLSKNEALSILEKHVAQKDYSPITNFCDHLRNRYTQKSFKFGDNRYFGKPCEPVDAFKEELHLSEDSKAYDKLVKNSCTFKSRANVCQRSNNSFARTIDGQLIEMAQFIVDDVNNKEYTLCYTIRTRNTSCYECPSIQEIVEVEDRLHAIETRHIAKLCVTMKINNKDYISCVPNMYWYS